MLIGREPECRLLNELMRERKNILILGPEGVGKSAIVEHVLADGPAKNVFYSKRSTSLKETLVNMVEFAIGSKNLKQKNILNLKKICYQLLEARPDYAVLDHVVWVEPKLYGFLTYLKELKITFVIVTRTQDKKNIGHLWMGLYDFEKLEIKNLNQAHAAQLIDHYASSFNLKVDTVTDFKKEVFKISEGNPKIIASFAALRKTRNIRLRVMST